MYRKLKAAKTNKQLLIHLGGEALHLKTEDGRLLDAMYFDVENVYPEKKKSFSEDSNLTVILCLGNSSLYENAKDIIRFYLTQGVHVMTFNYGGYGLSQGSPSVFNTYRDVEAAYLYISEIKKAKDRKIIVHGFSIGGGPATYLASKYPVDLVLDRTYAKLGSIVGGLLGRLTDYLYPYDNVRKIQSIKGNIHIVEAANDEIMAQHHVEALFNEIIRVRHPDAHGSEIEKLRSSYITVVPSSHTDCWLSDVPGIYENENKKFSNCVIAPHIREQNPSTSLLERFLSRLWRKTTE